MKKLNCFYLISLLLISNVTFGVTKIIFTPSLTTTYTTNSNVFSEREDPQTATSYTLIPSASLNLVLGKRLRSTLAYRYSSSQYLTPPLEDLEDKAEDRGMDRESVVELRNSTVSLATEYGFHPKLSADLMIRHDVSGLPAYESSYYNSLSVTPGIWFTLSRNTTAHVTYNYNHFRYPLKEVPEKDELKQQDIESGGALMVMHKLMPSTRFGLGYQYGRNESNDKLADYETSNGYLNLWQNFGPKVKLQITGHLRQRQYISYPANDSDKDRYDNFTGVYNNISIKLSKYAILMFGYDSLLNASNHDEAEYAKSFVYAGLTLIPGSYKYSF